jgi:putative transposase
VAALRLIAERDFSQRHACRLLEVDPKTVRRPERLGDEAVRVRLRTLAGERRRFGYRRLGILLEREGVRMNHKKLYRLYREEGLAVRRRRGRKRATGTRAPLALPQAPDQRWSLDFVSDGLAAGRRFRILVVVDDCTRECLAAVADSSISGVRVAVSSTRSSPGAVTRRRSSATTAPSSRRERSSRGPTEPALAGTTSHPASPSRTPSSRVSSAGSGTSCSTRRSSTALARPDG